MYVYLFSFLQHSSSLSREKLLQHVHLTEKGNLVLLIGLS